MLRRFRPVALLLVFCGVSLVLSAQEEGKVALSLHDCIAMALQQQSDVHIGENSVSSAKARLTQAKSSYYPQVSVQASKEVIQLGKGTQDAQTAISLTQSIYDGGLREVGASQAKYQVAEATAALLRAKQTVIYSVTKAYFSLLRTQALARVATQQVASLEEQLAMADARIQAGEAAAVEALPIRAQLANARVSDLAARNSTLMAKVQLQQAMGLMPSDSIMITEVLKPQRSFQPACDTCLDQALSLRPELLQNTALIGSAQSGVRSAKIILSPRPVISGQVSQPVGTVNNTLTYSVNAGISFNLFDGRSAQAAYVEAKLSLANAETRAAQMRKDIAAEVQQAYLTVMDAQARIQAAQLGLEAARANADAQEGRYQQGMAIALDLVNARFEVATAENNAVQAQYDFLTALAQLHYAMGMEGELTWE